LFRYVLPLVSIFVVVVGAMSGGLADPTESAALARSPPWGSPPLYRR
jgi:TRAP-type mannitol/chloroaromatic compound transport system permease large subunit